MQAVGPAGQDNGRARAKHDTGRVGAGHEDQVFRQHVAGFEIWYDQDLGAAGHGRHDSLQLRGLRAYGIVHGQRPVQYAPGDLAAVGHLAQNGGIGRAGDLCIDDLDGRKDGNARFAQAKADMQVDGVLDDVALAVEVGKDVDRRIGDEKDLRIAWRGDQKDVADASTGATRHRTPLGASAHRCGYCLS